MEKYKYLIQSNLSQKEVNDLGNKGWKLISVVWEQDLTRNVFYFQMKLLRA